MYRKRERGKRQDMIMRLIDEIEIYTRDTKEKRHNKLREEGYTDEQINSIEAEAWTWIMEAARELGSTENCVKQIYSRHFRKEN